MNGKLILAGLLSLIAAGPVRGQDAAAANPHTNPVPSQVKHSFVCTDYTQGEVFIVSREGKTEWEYDGATNSNDIWVLPGGHLFFNTGRGVKEVTPDKRVVWTFSGGNEIKTISSALILDESGVHADAPEVLH